MNIAVPSWYQPPGVVQMLPKVSIARRLLIYTAERMHSRPDEIVGDGRNKHLIHARALVATVLRERGWSTPRIGKALGGRDHSTVCHALKQFPAYLRTNKELQPILTSLRFMSRGGE